MKKFLSIILVLLICFSMTACGSDDTPEVTVDNTIMIPDIVDTDESTAKNVLSSNGLIPSVKYENSDDVEEGLVIKTEPSVGTSVDKNSKVVVYISKGPSYIEAKDARIQWYSLSSEKDDWEAYTPYIEDGILYIKCHDVSFGCKVKWKDTYNEGRLIGVGSITDTFDKTIPVSAKYEKQSWKANEKQDFTLEIPLNDLNVSKPTDMYLRLYTEDGDDVRVNFYISW